MRVKSLLIVASAILVLSLGSIALVGCSSQDVSGSGKMVNQTYDYKDFKNLEIEGGFDFSINHSTSYVVSTSIDSNLQQYLEIEKNGDTLKVGFNARLNITNADYSVAISLPNIENLKVRGSCTGVVENFDSLSKFNFSTNDAVTLAASNINADITYFSMGHGTSVNVTNSSFGDLNIFGTNKVTINFANCTANIAYVSLFDSCSMYASTLASTHGIYSVMDSSTAQVNAQIIDYVGVSYTSTLLYVGTPEIKETHVSSDSTFAPMS